MFLITKTKLLTLFSVYVTDLCILSYNKLVIPVHYYNCMDICMCLRCIRYMEPHGD